MFSTPVKQHCTNNLKKIFGRIKKIISSLHCKTKNNNSKMLRTQKHIDAKNGFGPVGSTMPLRGQLCCENK